MSDSVWPHRRQPTRLPRPWDSPGKNTGVGCHFLLQYMKVKSESEVTQSCPTFSDPMDCSLPGSSVHGIFPGKSTGVGCHCLLWLNSLVPQFTNNGHLGVLLKASQCRLSSWGSSSHQILSEVLASEYLVLWLTNSLLYLKTKPGTSPSVVRNSLELGQAIFRRTGYRVEAEGEVKKSQRLSFIEGDYFSKNWSTVDLQCCVNDCCTAKWLLYIYLYF